MAKYSLCKLVNSKWEVVSEIQAKGRKSAKEIAKKENEGINFKQGGTFKLRKLSD